jgi:DNA modification methylase
MINFTTENGTLYQGDCLEILRSMPDNSVDSVVTDPPYGLSFMGKHWDYDVPSVDIWVECLRVLKPGGFLLAACGTRTQHRMAVNIEGAGFEIRDLIAWIYGSGFPKSLDIGKAIDKMQGNEREVVGEVEPFGREGRKTNGKPKFDQAGWDTKTTKIVTKGNSAYEGWGTALKPAMELWTVARKPIEGTVAGNVLKWGTGGINVDGCRVGSEKLTFLRPARNPNT